MNGCLQEIKKQDAYITTYTAHKPWALSGSQFDSYGIQAFNSAEKYNPTLQTLGPLAAKNNTSYTAQSLAQLYYPTRSAAGEIVSHSFDYYDQTTLTLSGSRAYDKNRVTAADTKPYLFSIPRNLYGVNIRPGSFKIKVDNPSSYATFVNDYVMNGYASNGGLPNLATTTDIVFLDDAEGNIYLSGSSPRYIVGDLIYPHGMAIITDDLYAAFFKGIQQPIQGIKGITWNPAISWTSTTMSFDSSHPIFTHNYHCKVRDLEYNFTYNPSALSSSIKTVYDSNGNIYSTSSQVNNGVVNSNLTGSAFQPYITTVGLYNDANQLIAVGKMPSPVPKAANTEMTIIVKIDI